MSKKEKLIARLKARSNNFNYNEAESLLLSLGFVKSNKGKTSGSRVIFTGINASLKIHKPHNRKELHDYQVKELILFLEKEGVI